MPVLKFIKLSTPIQAFPGLALLVLISIISNSKATQFVEKRIGVVGDSQASIVIGIKKMIHSSKIEVFQGIPYAEPPIGDRRFRRPELMLGSGSRSVINATQPPPSCYQNIDTSFGRFSGVEMWNPNTEMSEDCLYLNIWAPESNPRGASASGGRAVLVWIYGGGFNTGTSTLDLYDGGVMASFGDVIVVSVQYRIGALGFAYLGSLDIPGNMGLLDQRVALQWIQHHIQSFGGDPARVTVFGESAGAASTSLHLLSDLSKDLIQYSIMQSASALCPWAGIPKEMAKQRTLKLAELVGCDSEKADSVLVACLRATDAATFTQSASGVLSEDTSPLQLAFLPTVDDYFLEAHPKELLRQGKAKKTNILLGVNQDEGSYFLVYNQRLKHIFNLQTNRPTLTDTEFSDSVRALMVDRSLNGRLVADAAAFEYGTPDDRAGGGGSQWSPQPPDILRRELYGDAIDDVMGDLWFVCPVVEFARAYAADDFNQSAYLYQFVHRTSTNPWPRWMGVVHGYEIDHVFGVPIVNNSYREEEAELSRKMIRHWTNFAKTGNPNTNEDGAPAVTQLGYSWPRYTAANQDFIVFNVTTLPAIERGLRARKCSFWRDLVPKLQAAGTCGASHILQPSFWSLLLTSSTILLRRFATLLTS